MKRHAGNILITLYTMHVFAGDSVMALKRTNAENYKDRALAACISAAYNGSPAGEAIRRRISL